MDSRVEWQRSKIANAAMLSGFPRSKAITYDPAHPHLPETVRDGSNQETSFAYNTNHQLTTITRPDASTVTYGYHGTTHRLSSVTSPAGTASTTYNGRGLPATTTSIEGITRSFTYDDLDRVLTITAPGSRTVTFDYRYRDEDGALALDSHRNPVVALEGTSVRGVACHWDPLCSDRVGRSVARVEPINGVVVAA
ncbi:MAG: hypothetical protein Q8M65_07205 [Rhodoglobus sp.]|nr:hypothetical protein [Rhodoglobus sp.]